jgi:hypothetical protein
MRNVHFKFAFALLIVSLIGAGLVFAGQTAPQKQPAPTQAAPAAPVNGVSANQIVDRIVGREAVMAAKMKNLHPLVETYLQNLDKDDDLAFHPTGDKYFIGKLDFNAEQKQQSLMDKDGVAKGIFGKFSQLYSVKYLPGGFAQMLVVDGHFDRKNYDFEYVRREFLGEVRTLVFDVKPKKGTEGTFKGRIWAEDQDYNIVRFNGTYGPSTATKIYFHFDSWREYMGKGEWLPAYVYTEESDMGYLVGTRHLRFKGQTRLWAYDVGKSNLQDELTALIVESDQVKDNADQAAGISPVEALRAWQREAEDNIIQRLQKAGVMAPDGEVSKVLETVSTNIEVTNNLNIDPPIRARVLLTAPLESFTIGHTIVLSRGLIDVLPDEASLAMIIAHELAHIALGHGIDTKYSFNDRMLFDDPETFQKIYLKRDPKEESEADKKATEFLQKSPYKDKLGNAGLFLKAVDQRAGQLENLLLPHIGNAMVKGREIQRMADLKQGAPQLEMTKVDQIAALPLGGRVRVDPWSGNIELVKSKPVALQSAREKMPFEVAPVYLYLTRQTAQPKPATPAAPAAAAAAATAAPADPGNQPSSAKQ